MIDKIRSIEITFPVDVEVADKEFQEFAELADKICKQWNSIHPGRVMWPFHFGSRLLVDPLALKDNEPIPGDDSVLTIGCFEREDYDAVCTKCGKRQGDHKICHPLPPAGDCDFEIRSS